MPILSRAKIGGNAAPVAIVPVGIRARFYATSDLAVDIAHAPGYKTGKLEEVGRQAGRKSRPAVSFSARAEQPGHLHHMTISASDGFDADDVLARNLGLYRDLSVALNDRVAVVKAVGGDADCKEALEAAKVAHRQLQTVLELEASLVKRSRSRTDGGERPLDLDAARAEILARLALWSGR